MPNYFREIFEYPVEEFIRYIENDRNSKIIFSGKYGAGKTRFLNDFFAKENQMAFYNAEKYNVITLSPVNYSISLNEDIIRFIKYDIIIEFLKWQTELEEFYQENLSKTLPKIAKNRASKIIKLILGMIPKVGKDIEKVYDAIEIIVKDYNEKIESDGDKLTKFLKEIESADNNIYANNTITKIINKILQKDQRQSVLIVDDIDRLDPDHVFRILNVFAAHFNEGNNLLNFEKVILVCDFHNIRTLFHHRYGSDADFAGYIDKFYSSEIFYFDNRAAVSSIIKHVLDSIVFVNKNGIQNDSLPAFFFGDNFVQKFLEFLSQNRLINLRSIIKLIGQKIDYTSVHLVFDNQSEVVQCGDFPILMQIKILRDFMGDYWNSLKVIESCAGKVLRFTDKESVFGLFMFIVINHDQQFSRDAAIIANFSDQRYAITAKSEGRNQGIQWTDVRDPADGKSPKKVSDHAFWQAFKKALIELNRLGFI